MILINLEDLKQNQEIRRVFGSHNSERIYQLAFNCFKHYSIPDNTPVKPERTDTTGYGDWMCGNCGGIVNGSRFCRFCGREVKWQYDL